MEHNPVQSLEEKPKTNLAGLVLGLGIGALAAIPVLGLIASLMRSALDPASVNPNRSIIGSGGFAGVTVSLLLSGSALAAGIKAYQNGERSWKIWAGLIIAILSGVLWITVIILNIAAGM